MKQFLLALSVILPAMAFAQIRTSQNDCTPLDLRNETLGENRDQKNVSWCYAFSSADNLAYANDLPERVSAADVAIAYNETKMGRLFRWLDLNILNPDNAERRGKAHQTGFSKIALNLAMVGGWCPERIFPSETWTKVIRTETGIKEVQVPLATAMLEISALHDIKNSITADNTPFYYKFKNVNAEGFVSFLQKKNVADFYSSLRRTVCRDDRVAFDHRWKVKMKIKNPFIFKRISQQLEAGRLVQLDYDSRILGDANHRGLKLARLHTSNILGRRWNQDKNSCEYMIRDSYGSTCSTRYDSTYECQKGNVWLPESSIYHGMTSIVYMLAPGK